MLLSVVAGRHPLLHLSRSRHRPRTIPENRSDRRRHRRRDADDRDRRHLARRGIRAYRFPHPGAALRHDGADCPPAHGAVLQRHRPVDRRARAPASTAPRRDRLRQRHPVGALRQRHDLPRLHAGPHRAGARPRPSPAPLPAGARHRRQHRQRRHDYGKPAEHADRERVADPLPPVPRRAWTGRALRPRARRARPRRDVSC